MALMTSNQFAKALWPGVRSWYGKEYNSYDTEWTHLVDTNTSRRKYEEDVGYSGMGLAAIKTEGNSFHYDSAKQGFTTRYVHTVYGLGFQITREMVDDDLYDTVAPRRSGELAFSMHQTKEIVVANVYNRATNASYTGGDGVSLLSTAHPNIVGGTWSNKPSIDVDISEAALEQACIDISKFTNDRGLKIKVLPSKLVVPYDLSFEVNRILKSQFRVGTANNDINVLYMMQKFPQGVYDSHYLTDLDAWFIRTNARNGLNLFQRDPMEFGMDNDHDTENAKFKARERYSVGWTDPRCIYGSVGG